MSIGLRLLPLRDLPQCPCVSGSPAAPRIRRRAVSEVLAWERTSCRLERICWKQSLVLQGLRLASHGRPVLKNSSYVLCTTSVVERNLNLDVRCQGQKVKLRLRLDHQIPFREHHALLGSTESAGSWTNRVMMEWTDAGWVVDLETDPGEMIEYKFIIVTWNGNVVWEHGANRVLVVPNDAGNHYEVVSHWSATQETIDFEIIHHAPAPEAWAIVAENEEQPEGNAKGLDIIKNEQEPDFGSSFVQDCQGKEISVVRLGKYSREWVGKWDITGLDRPARFLVEGDHKSASWWSKLDVVRALLTGDLGKTERLESLITSAIYLKWINTGQIPCGEEGEYHYPNKNAAIPRYIFRELERITSERVVSPKEVLAVRRMHPCLPAFKPEFTASVSLTRIQDIVHRNDIPHDLKSDIKHTIQNKLYRNVRPEDLAATEAMLARVTKIPGEYSGDFVQELKIFYAELRDFFNAGSLTEQLDGLRDSLDEQNLAVLERFLDSKNNLDDAGHANNGISVESSKLLVATLHNLTGLRAALAKGLESGIRNDAPDTAIAMRQKWRLSDIGLEDYARTLLSRFMDGLESCGGAKLLIKEAQSTNVSTWNQTLTVMVFGIRQIGLSCWQQRECLAIENELLAWQSAGIFQKEGLGEDTRLWAQRVKATLDRGWRLAEAYTDTLFQLYAKHGEKLGNAFGLPENSVKTFIESEIRASVAFQLSKVISLLLKAAGVLCGSGGWNAVIPGDAIGTLIEVPKIVPGSLPSSSTGPVVLLVKEANGDEE